MSFIYYDVKKYWTKKILPHLGNPRLNKLLVKEFNKFTYGTWGKPFLPDMFPLTFDCTDWLCGKRGCVPRYYHYTCHLACHWLVNFNWTLATMAEPEVHWFIQKGEDHSTVFSEHNSMIRLFDLNFFAYKIDPEECFDLSKGDIIEYGKLAKTGFAPHYTMMGD